MNFDKEGFFSEWICYIRLNIFPFEPKNLSFTIRDTTLLPLGNLHPIILMFPELTSSRTGQGKEMSTSLVSVLFNFLNEFSVFINLQFGSYFTIRCLT